ncbi:MAG TPA: hypothetical protein PK402_12965, partial [Tepidisphaeraceae bacterium]|nr:hypothetical protein [Tepidisphaeraceae bacterium]
MTDLNSETPPKGAFASKYRRPLIAVCMVVLMLAFLIPSQLPNLRRQTNQKFGTLNGKVIRAADLRDSHNRWNYLKRVVVQTQRGRVPLVHAIFGPGSSSDKLIGMLDRHPEAYMLLLKEAHEDGPGGSDMAATDLIDSGFSGERGRVPIEVVLEEDRVENLSQLDMEAAAPYRAALSDLLAILNRADMLSRSIKPSIPLVDRRVAATDQSITAQLLEFRSADYVSRVAAPTDEQLNQQFKRFAANPRGQLAPENEFGFGYKIPNRVKLQVIQIPGDAVRELVRNSKDVNPDRDDPTLPYGWVVEAYKEYSLNKWKYIPAPDESATQPTSAPTEPRPFPQVRREIVEALISQETAKKMQQIEQRIRNRIEGDYQTWKTAREINAPATQSSFNVTFESVEYLNELANDIERQFGVRLTIASYADRFYDANDLSQLADIGRSFLPLGSGVQMQPLPFGSYAIDLFVPF